MRIAHRRYRELIVEGDAVLAMVDDLAVERPALQPLPGERFPCFQEVQRLVHRDGHVEVDKAYYSVPPEYLARRVWVRWDSRLVRVFNDRMESIAVHPKHEPGRFSTHNQHIASAKISGVERGGAWLLGQVRRLGPHSTRWAEAVIANRDVEGIRVVQGLLSLARRHSVDAIEKACDIALSHGAFRLRTVRALLDREAPRVRPGRLRVQIGLPIRNGTAGRFRRIALAERRPTAILCGQATP